LDPIGGTAIRRNALVENEKTARHKSLRRAVDCLSRDDKTTIELFLTGIWGWEAGLRRKLENGKSG
jgi:hypothetical protein